MKVFSFLLALLIVFLTPACAEMPFSTVFDDENMIMLRWTFTVSDDVDLQAEKQLTDAGLQADDEIQRRVSTALDVLRELSVNSFAEIAFRRFSDSFYLSAFMHIEAYGLEDNVYCEMQLTGDEFAFTGSSLRDQVYVLSGGDALKHLLIIFPEIEKQLSMLGNSEETFAYLDSLKGFADLTERLAHTELNAEFLFPSMTAWAKASLDEERFNDRSLTIQGDSLAEGGERFKEDFLRLFRFFPNMGAPSILRMVVTRAVDGAGKRDGGMTIGHSLYDDGDLQETSLKISNGGSLLSPDLFLKYENDRINQTAFAEAGIGNSAGAKASITQFERDMDETTHEYALSLSAFMDVLMMKMHFHLNGEMVYVPSELPKAEIDVSISESNFFKMNGFVNTHSFLINQTAHALSVSSGKTPAFLNSENACRITDALQAEGVKELLKSHQSDAKTLSLQAIRVLTYYLDQ